LDPERSDENLIRAFLAGDHDAFSDLMRRHEDRVLGLAFRITGNRPDALDATQEAFISAFRRAGSFRFDSAFTTWMHRVTLNACYDLMRKRGKATPEEQPEREADRGAAQVDDAVALRLDVAHALAALPEDYREAVVMHDLGGIPYEEIATVTGVAIGTVKSRISRGRRRLAELLEPGGDALTSKGLR
jgi:RNA polymerase sigma-70 factor (ECF subfamily)